jgi:diacylglycerol O-acyltransferase / wax synthase
VPGARVPLYLAGARMEAHFPVSVITDGVGRNITCMSHLDGVDVGIVADADQLDDAWPLVDGMKHALDELHAAVVERSPAST